jgi:excisionase family DNA binding protein
MTDRIYSVEEVAGLLKIGISTTYMLVRNGTIQGFKIGYRWKISESALNNYIERQSGQ